MMPIPIMANSNPPRFPLNLLATSKNSSSVFSNVLLIGMPMIFSLNYRPEASNTEELFFDVARKLSGNLGGSLFAMIGIGVIVSFFALVAPKGSKVEAK